MSEPKAEKRPKKGNRLKLIFLASAGGIVLCMGAATAYAFYYSPRFLPRTEIAGVHVGGMRKPEAAAAVSARAEAFSVAPLKLSHEGKEWEISPREIGASFDVDSALAAAWEEEKSTDWRDQLAELFKAPFRASRFDVSVAAYDDAGEAVLRERVLKDIETAYKETTLSFSASGATVVPGEDGQRLDAQAFSQELEAAFNASRSSVALRLEPFSPKVTPEAAEGARLRASALLAAGMSVRFGNQKMVSVSAEELAAWLVTEPLDDAAGLRLSVKEEPLKARIAEWVKGIDQAPTNVRLAKDGDGVKVAAADKDGLAVNQQATLDAFKAYVKTSSSEGSVEAVVEAAKAEVRADNYAELGLVNQIGTNTTDFSGSPTNRKINIGVGQRALDMKLVKDGETFSTVGELSPIETTNGYVPELVIKGNRTIPEAGGGLCQVSTTLFRAVLAAGLPIVERQNHSYRVGYYERTTGPGLDATVYDPNPDFKWKNDTGKPVYVQSFVKGNTVGFEVYGTSDGRVSNISAPTILETYKVGDPIYADTDTLEKGVTKQVETAHDGAKTSVTYSVTRNGEKIYGREFISVYKAWPAQYLVGTR